MSPLEGALLVTCLAGPPFLLVQHLVDRMEDPAWLRTQGIVIVRASALQACEGDLGSYDGHRIWATVVFKGMRYDFDHLARPRDREATAPGELYLDPGLVYRLAA